MSESRSTLRSWRERIGTPIKETQEDSQGKVQSANAQTPQTHDSLRVGLRTEASANPPVQYANPPEIERPRLVRVGPTTWREADWCKDLCVMCDNHLDNNDKICCVNHRVIIDAHLSGYYGKIYTENVPAQRQLPGTDTRRNP